MQKKDISASRFRVVKYSLKGEIDHATLPIKKCNCGQSIRDEGAQQSRNDIFRFLIGEKNG
jgi:hypothetical protein